MAGANTTELREAPRIPKAAKRPGTVTANGASHTWAWAQGLWRCRKCAAVAWTDGAKERRLLELCQPHRLTGPLLHDARLKGHKIALPSIDGQRFPYCVLCGAYSNVWIWNLAECCPGQPRNQTAGSTLNKLKQGIHLESGKFLTK